MSAIPRDEQIIFHGGPSAVVVTTHVVRAALTQILRHKACRTAQVHQVFEENNTAYMAMAVVNGEDMLSIVDNEPERLTPRVLTRALKDALSAIGYIHDLGILHRDISPDNLLLDDHDHLTLIDFGAAREHAGKENRALSALLAVKDGYSPHEFYLTDIEQTPASDLYSLGATFYHLITGAAPPNSQDRVAALAEDQPDPYVPLLGGDWNFEDNFLAAIDQSLAVLQKDRIASTSEWLELLKTPLKRAVAAVPVDAGDIACVISQLVEDTNKNVKQGMPGYAKQLAVQRLKNRRHNRATDYGQEQRAEQRVDIFGNPIENVDAWMRDQERALRAQPKAVRKEGVTRQMRPAKSSVSGEDRPTSRSTFGRLLAACLPLRRESASSALQN